MKTDMSRPTVGDNVLGYVGSGRPSRPSSSHTTAVAKATMGRGSSPTGKKTNRGNTQISEANGPKCKIVSKLYEANAADAGLQTRNIRILPSAAGVTDFQKARVATGQVY
jgi:hypothetical protein